MPAKPTVPRFSLGQIWQPERGHPGPTIRLVIIHRPDRLIEAIDTFAPDRLTAKRTIIRFRDLRQHHRLQEADDAERTGRKASDA